MKKKLDHGFGNSGNGLIAKVKTIASPGVNDFAEKGVQRQSVLTSELVHRVQVRTWIVAPCWSVTENQPNKW